MGQWTFLLAQCRTPREGTPVALYEHMLIARQDISAQAVDALATHLKTIIETEGGKVEKQEYWGLRTLAYRIKKNRKGHYVLLNLNAPSNAISELERQLYSTISVAPPPGPPADWGVGMAAMCVASMLDAGACGAGGAAGEGATGRGEDGGGSAGAAACGGGTLAGGGAAGVFCGRARSGSDALIFW